jgi:hypothetical protein
MSTPPDAPSHDDDVTTEFPAIGEDRPRRDSILPWLIVGGVVGIIALVIFAGGLRDPATSATDSTASTIATRTVTATVPASPSPTTVVPSVPTPTTVPLEVRATDPQGVAIEVRRGGPAGALMFAGIVAQGEVRRFAVRRGAPLWLSLAWAPSAAVRVDGVHQPTTGGTETYRVTPTGLHRLTTAASTGTTSR